MASNDDQPVFRSPFSNDPNETVPNETVKNASATGTDTGVADSTNRSASSPQTQKLKSSRAYSVASPAADPARRAPIKAENPHAIPTAGGIAMGQRAAEDRERRKSQWQPTPDMSHLDEEGSPNVVTQNNTQANVVPQSEATSSSKADSSERTDSKSSADKVADKMPHGPSAANKDRRGSSKMDSLKGLFKTKN